MEKFPSMSAPAPQEGDKKIDWDKVTIEGNEQGVESLRANLESGLSRLEDNTSKLEGVLSGENANTPEGQELAESFIQKTRNRFSNFGKGLLEKASHMREYSKFQDKLAGTLIGVGVAATVIPTLTQWARTQFPEFGVMVDSAPDAIQQLLHIDMYFDTLKQFVSELKDVPSLWKHGGVEETQLLAGLANGSISLDSLNDAQKTILDSSASGTFDFLKSVLKHDGEAKMQYFAAGDVIATSGIKGMCNGTMVAALGIAASQLTQRIGNYAHKKLEK